MLNCKWFFYLWLYKFNDNYMKKEDLQTSDYLPFYAQYINLAPNLGLAEALAEGMLKVSNMFEELPETLHEYSYEDGKWTPKEILQHIVDTERVFVYRALTFARTENVELPGFDQDIFVLNGNAMSQTMDSLIKEYIATRTATIFFFKTLDDQTLNRKGIASGGPLSVAAAGYIISGHELHHCKILKERYIK